MSGITFGITSEVPQASPRPPLAVPAQSADELPPPSGSGGRKKTATDSRRPARVKNIIKRGNIWYFKKMIAGKRKFLSLNTTEKVVAAARARVLGAAAGNEKWTVLDGVQSKRTVATVPEVLALFEAAAPGRNLGEQTVKGYKHQLLNVLRTVHGPMADNAYSTALLTEDLVLQYQDRVLAKAGRDRSLTERAQRTVRSTIVNARAVFAPWTARAYKGLKLPDLTGFRKAVLNRALVKSYRLPPADLVERTLKEGRELREKNPPLYAVFLLCYDLGLRAGEAAAAEWSWFGMQGDQRVIEILRRANFTPKWNKERRVPVSDDVWAHLTGLKSEAYGSDGKHLVPGASPGLRGEFVSREFSGWMRSIGWDRKEYPKAAHELRKLMGSRWFTECGAEVAQELLGHENVATTCSFYTALRRQPKPLKMDF